MARDFNGSTDRLDWANISNTVSALTISSWVYVDTIGQLRYVFASHNSANTGFAEIFGFGYVDSTHISLFMNAQGATALQRGSDTFNPSTIAGAWHHILMTWDGGTTATNAHLYLDGTELAYTTPINGATLTAGTGVWSLGGRIYDDNRNFDGKIAEFGVWNRVLSAGEIAALAAGATPGAYSTNLLHYYSALTDTTTAEIGGAAATADGTSYSSAHPTITRLSPHFRRLLQGV
jgi:hypothetical protein